MFCSIFYWSWDYSKSQNHLPQRTQRAQGFKINYYIFCDPCACFVNIVVKIPSEQPFCKMLALSQQSIGLVSGETKTGFNKNYPINKHAIVEKAASAPPIRLSYGISLRRSLKFTWVHPAVA